MSWTTLSARETLRRLRAGAHGVDVRSEGEFAHGALPHFTNVPVLDDRQRHLVGLTYKQHGPTAAVALGHELVDPLRETLIERWANAWRDAAPEERVLICWRGGLRSSSAADALAAAGVAGYRVEGGYKAIRGELLAVLEAPPPLLVLTGFTGSGKTEILRFVRDAVDLEAMANHRGSAFGAAVDSVQPSQQTFENALGFALMEPRVRAVVEDESAMIGRRILPREVHRRIATAAVVVVDVPIEERARRSFEEYVRRPAELHGRERVRAHLQTALRAVQARLGGLRAREIGEAIDDGFREAELTFEPFAAPITRLLREYYDPSYAYGMERAGRSVVFRGTTDEVIAYLNRPT